MTKTSRREGAIERQKARNARSTREQIELVLARPGKSARELARLQKKLAEEQAK